MPVLSRLLLLLPSLLDDVDHPRLKGGSVRDDGTCGGVRVDGVI